MNSLWTADLRFGLWLKVSARAVPAFAVAAAALGLAVLMTTVAMAKPSESVLYDFAGGTDGRTPEGALIADKTGALYGTTYNGGDGYLTVQQCYEGCGIVYKLTPPAGGAGKWKETVLHRFQGTDGYAPSSVVIMDGDGALYGTTYGGGTGACPGISGGCGVVFKLTPAKTASGAWTETILHTFTGGKDGASPSSGVIFYEGELFGTTGYGAGTVYKLTRPKSDKAPWTETILYSFKGGEDGETPSSGVIVDKSGIFYGSTIRGGGACPDNSIGCGTVYQLAPPKPGTTRWIETVLRRFDNGAYGGEPQGNLALDADGNLYGTAEEGGDDCLAGGAYGCGIAFELMPPKAGQKIWPEQVIHKFEGPDGLYPVTGMVRIPSGTLYGTTPTGESNVGVVFSLAPPKSGKGNWILTPLYSFTSLAAGETPGQIAEIGGILYGATEAGGSCPKVTSAGCGVAFKEVP